MRSTSEKRKQICIWDKDGVVFFEAGGPGRQYFTFSLGAVQLNLSRTFWIIIYFLLNFIVYFFINLCLYYYRVYWLRFFFVVWSKNWYNSDHQNKGLTTWWI